MNKILFTLFAVFLLVSIGYSQDAPEDSTEHFSIFRWAEDANPGHDAINNNWEVIDSAIYHAERHLTVTIIDPHSVYGIDSLICLVPSLSDSITISNIEATCSIDTIEITGDIMYADAFIGQADSVLINDFNTTSGVRSDSSIAQGGVPAGKTVYLYFDAEPNAVLKSFTIDITYSY